MILENYLHFTAVQSEEQHKWRLEENAMHHVTSRTLRRLDDRVKCASLYIHAEKCCFITHARLPSTHDRLPEFT